MSEAEQRPVLVIGLAGVNWTELVRRVSAGALPAFTALLREAAAGPLICDAPPVGPARWAGLVTGRRPLDHGVVTPDEPWAGGLRAASAASWRVQPLWARLAAAGLRTASVGWPASRPGASWPGDHVDDAFAVAHGETWDHWVMPHGQVRDELREAMRSLRVHPHDVTGQMLLPFVPALQTIDQSRNHGLVPLAIALAKISTEHAAVSELMVSTRHDAFFVQHDWLAEIERSFTNVAPPFDGVLDAAWTLLDQLIGRMVSLAAGRTIIIAGLGGGGQPGILIATGPGIGQGKLAGATLLDIAPTILDRLGFSDETLPGRALLPGSANVTSLPSAARSPSNAEVNQADLARVASFGFQPPVAAARAEARRLVQQADLLLTSDTRAALELVDEALASSPDDINALGLKAAAHVILSEAANIEPIAEKLAAMAPNHPWLPLIQAAILVLRDDRAAARPLLAAVEAQGIPDLVMRAGMLWLQLRGTTEAERCARAILAKRPGDIGALQLLAASLATKPAEAEAAWKGILMLDPVNAIAREALEKLLRSLGRSHEADELKEHAN